MEYKIRAYHPAGSGYPALFPTFGYSRLSSERDSNNTYYPLRGYVLRNQNGEVVHPSIIFWHPDIQFLRDKYFLIIF